MILVDYSAAMYPVIHKCNPKEFDPASFMNSFISTLLSYKKKFESDYGEIAIAMDSKPYWRSEIFPHYKANRKVLKEKSGIDWDFINDVTKDFTKGFIQAVPWRIYNVDTAEADDIIYVIGQEKAKTEKVLILSGDKDFAKLHRHPNIYQYGITQKKWIVPKDPVRECEELIIMGDANDGIPNIFSPDNAFVEKIRQTPATAKKVNEILDNPALLIRNYRDRYEMNKQLIDLDCIPSHIVENIKSKIDVLPLGNMNKLYKYFVSKKLSARVLSNIQDFATKKPKENKNEIRSGISSIEELFG